MYMYRNIKRPESWCEVIALFSVRLSRRSFIHSFLRSFLSRCFTTPQVDKDGNVKRTASTFRKSVSPADPLHKPGAWLRSASEMRNSISPVDPLHMPGAWLRILSPRVM